VRSTFTAVGRTSGRLHVVEQRPDGASVRLALSAVDTADPTCRRRQPLINGPRQTNGFVSQAPSQSPAVASTLLLEPNYYNTKKDRNNNYVYNMLQ